LGLFSTYERKHEAFGFLNLANFTYDVLQFPRMNVKMRVKNGSLKMSASLVKCSVERVERLHCSKCSRTCI
jgi:hypothetical protein